MVVTREAGQIADSVRFVETTSTGVKVSSSVPFSPFEKAAITSRTSAELHAAEPASNTASEGHMQVRAAGDIPAACNFYRFELSPGCIVQSPNYTEVGPGTSPSDYGPAVTACTPATIGSSFSGTTPAAGGSVCYQFVINATATVNSQVVLPAGVTGIVELFAVLPNYLGLKVIDAKSPSDPLNVNVTSAYHRYILVVRPGTGTGGQTFNIGIGAPAIPLPVVPNTDVQHPKVLQMNQTQTDAISTTGQKDFYYFFPSTKNQTTVEFLSNFSADQTVGYRTAQRSAAGVYTLSTEVILTNSQANQTLNIPGIVSNTSGATVVNGLLVRVSAKVPTAPVAGSFSVRAGVMTGYINNASLANFEGLTRSYPNAYGLVQAYSYVSVGLYVIDVNGAPVLGEAVQIDVYRDEFDPNTKQTYTGITNATGFVGFTPSIAGCPSNTQFNDLITNSSPADHWQMIGQYAKVDILLPNATPVAPNDRSNFTSRRYYKVCQETYLGHP